MLTEPINLAALIPVLMCSLPWGHQPCLQLLCSTWVPPAPSPCSDLQRGLAAGLWAPEHPLLCPCCAPPRTASQGINWPCPGAGQGCVAWGRPCCTGRFCLCSDLFCERAPLGAWGFCGGGINPHRKGRRGALICCSCSA